jgi:hypothetical protein
MPVRSGHSFAPALARVMLFVGAALWGAVGCAAGYAADLSPAPYWPPVTAGRIASPALSEASGMAASLRRPGCFWMINDGGNGPVIHAVGPTGQDLGSVTLAGAENWDWEDIASFSRAGKPYLLIADTGDNRAVRQAATLYLIQEPAITERRETDRRKVTPSRVYRFRFPEGPTDCEALAVEPEGSTALLLTKRLRPPLLYSLDLAGAGGGATARRLMAVTTIPSPSEAELLADPIYGRFRSQPTAMDISPDGRRVAVLTYGGAYLYRRTPRESWKQVFSRLPEALPPFDLRQAESICFGSDGRTLFLSSEKRPAPLLRLEPMNDMKP